MYTLKIGPVLRISYSEHPALNGMSIHPSKGCSNIIMRGYNVRDGGNISGCDMTTALMKLNSCD